MSRHDSRPVTLHTDLPMTCKEIADVLGTSQQYIDKVMHTALKKARAEMERRGYTTIDTHRMEQHYPIPLEIIEQLEQANDN